MLRKDLTRFLVGAGMCLLCWSASASALASATIEPGASYKISGQELTKLSTDLQQLKIINARQQKRLNVQEQQITQLQKLLQTSNEALKQANETSSKANASLTSANESLMTLSAAAKKERLRIKAQRNGWFAVAILAATAAIIK